MSKELEALRGIISKFNTMRVALESFYRATQNVEPYIPDIDKEIIVIDNAIKRLEELEIENSKQFKEKWVQDNLAMTFELNTANKKLRALEVFINKNIDLKTLKSAFIFNGNNKEQCEMYNVNQWQWIFELENPGCVNIDRDKLPQLTQEEFNLLKEVLL